MKKLTYLIVLALILGLTLTGCLLSNVGQVPTSEQSGISYLTKGIDSPLDLVGLWHFDNDVFDSSGNNIHGTLKPTGSEPTYPPGNYGTALLFDGVDEYVDFGAAVDNSITTAITLEAWIRYSSAQNDGIISNDLTWISKKGYDFFLENGKLGIDVGNGTVVGRVLYPMPAPDPVNPVWYHVAATWNGNMVRLYVDGDEVGTPAPLSGNYSSPNQATYAGRINSPIPYYSYPFEGTIDEVRIWSSALADTQLDDMTAPAITITAPVDSATYLLDQVVNAGWSVTDGNETGVASESGTVLSDLPIDTATVGSNNFEVTATDYAKNTDTITVTYNVLGFSGILPPIKPDGTRVFKKGSTIPVKFRLWDADGNPITDAEASISLDEVISGIPVGEAEDGGSTSAATEGNLFRYDDTDNQYIFNLATKNLSTGTWEITITVNDTGSYSVRIGLK